MIHLGLNALGIVKGLKCLLTLFDRKDKLLLNNKVGLIVLIYQN